MHFRVSFLRRHFLNHFDLKLASPIVGKWQKYVFKVDVKSKVKSKLKSKVEAKVESEVESKVESKVESTVESKGESKVRGGGGGRRDESAPEKIFARKKFAGRKPRKFFSRPSVEQVRRSNRCDGRKSDALTIGKRR